MRTVILIILTTLISFNLSLAQNEKAKKDADANLQKSLSLDDAGIVVERGSPVTAEGNAIFGNPSNGHIAIDDDDIQAKSAIGANYATLFLNYYGGNINIADGNIHVDRTNNRVGIGTTFPGTKLYVTDANENGNVITAENTAPNGTAIYGECVNGVGVEGSSATGAGVRGTSSNIFGVYGKSYGAGAGVYGESDGGPGVQGMSNSTQHPGVRGTSIEDIGVHGTSTNYAGVWGESTQYHGVNGVSSFGRGVSAYSSNYRGLVAETGNTTSSWAGYFIGDVFSSGSYTPSDSKLKKDILPLENALSIVAQLKSHTYTYKEDTDLKNLPVGQRYGLLAQELEQVLPQLVKTTTDSGHEKEFKAVNYVELIPILLTAIQELQAEVENLKNTRNK